ncbi:MAG TPA: ABC-F family ATP-binding cassette domain-containing protein [Methylomirabilota bacterium]|jgi:ATP-binding cassette subfamily F protein 3|nr:ABC-F family ATP-binding cassette domain-containing protein [Methylomirabilota bacterium]
MIQAEAIAKAYGGQVLFRDVSWRITAGERIGLVGPNGAGKTTLCRILAGLEEPDAGRVHRDRGTTIGYLPQEVAASRAGSVLAEALSGFAEVWALERAMEAAAAALATEPSEALTAQYGELQHRFEALGGYRLETEARAVLGGLGFRPTDLGRPLDEFSGGFRMRAALARLLLLRPALLLLDEPTNHLDLESLAWLESYLAGYDGAVVVVAHDRYFLNRMVTAIAELGPDGLALYTGDYDDHLVERDARRALREAQARNQAKRVAEIERFIERFRYKATKARQVQSRIKMLERLERIEVAPETRQIRLAFPAPPRTGRRVATLRDVHKAYADHVVYAGIDLGVERGDRMALVGVNGAGKSTLLRILAGVLAFERGERTLGAQVTVHYYAQHQLDALDPARTVLEELEQVAPDAGQTRLRTILGAFLFSGDAVEKKIAVLSGGEKARVALAKMLVRPAPLLCLDEPTNHLDLTSRERVEQALADFPGTIVFISHDRYFINRLATKVVEVAGGRLTVHLGNYDDYRAAVALSPAAGEGQVRALAATPPAREPRRRPRVDPEVRAMRRRLEELESQIHALEDRLRQLGEALGDPALYLDGERVRTVAAERKRAEEQVTWLMREWEELSTTLAAHE